MGIGHRYEPIHGRRRKELFPRIQQQSLLSLPIRQAAERSTRTRSPGTGCNQLTRAEITRVSSMCNDRPRLALNW
jgi:hypothetical protein